MSGYRTHVNNRTIIKISPPSIPSGVFRGSPAGLSRVSRGSIAGLPRVEGMSTPPQKGTVLGRYRGVRGEGIKSDKCTSVPAYQQFSKIYTCARAGVFMETAGTLARWHTRPLAGRQAAIAPLTGQ